jgi:MFS family permease
LTNDISLSLNPITPTLHSITHARKNPVVFASILSISWFWLYGALLLTQLPPFVKITLAGNETTVTLLLALFTIGIGAGSMLCNLLSNHTIRPSLIAVGAIGMALVGIDFGLTAQHFQTANSLYSNLSFWHILIDLTLIGVFGGLYSVPLYALMQMLSDPVFRSRIIAANNILNALFMVAGAVITILLLNQGWSIPDIFLTMALCTAVVAGVISFKLRKI